MTPYGGNSHRPLNVVTRQVYRLREQLYQQLREEAVNKDLPTYVGSTDAFYSEVVGIAMRMASDRNITTKHKQSALNIALQATKDRAKFFEMVGFHSAMKLSPSINNVDAGMDRANALQRMARAVLEGTPVEDAFANPNADATYGMDDDDGGGYEPPVRIAG